MLELVILIVIATIFAGVCMAISRIANHMQGNPEATKAMIEHFFLPLFGAKPKPEAAELEDKPPVKLTNEKEVF